MIYVLIALDFMMSIAFLIRYTHLPPQVPLFYSRPWGEEQLGDVWMIFIPVVLLHIYIFLNSYIYQRYFITEPLVKKINMAVNWFLIVVCAFSFLKIIFLIS